MFLKEIGNTNRLFSVFLGLILFSLGIFIIAGIFFPVAQAEITYQNTKPIANDQEIVPVNTDFSIIIPKININAPIIKDVDPFSSREYQVALTKGIAHAKNSSLPGFPGNVFLFAHSATDWYQANRYNAIFYLTSKLALGDQIILYYQGSKYLYHVTAKKTVNSSQIDYLTAPTDQSTLTLMTCWPPGTTFKRLLIIASL